MARPQGGPYVFVHTLQHCLYRHRELSRTNQDMPLPPVHLAATPTLLGSYLIEINRSLHSDSIVKADLCGLAKLTNDATEGMT